MNFFNFAKFKNHLKNLENTYNFQGIGSWNYMPRNSPPSRSVSSLSSLSTFRSPVSSTSGYLSDYSGGSIFLEDDEEVEVMARVDEEDVMVVMAPDAVEELDDPVPESTSEEAAGPSASMSLKRSAEDLPDGEPSTKRPISSTMEGSDRRFSIVNATIQSITDPTHLELKMILKTIGYRFFRLILFLL